MAIYFGEELVTFVEKTDVYFKDITNIIDDYLASKEWMCKAGAYGIQVRADCFVYHVDGYKNNVIGLPLSKVMEVLKQHISFENLTL